MPSEEGTPVEDADLPVEDCTSIRARRSSPGFRDFGGCIAEIEDEGS